MTPDASVALADLTARGWRFSTNDGRLFYDAPQGCAFDEELALVRAHRSEIITALGAGMVAGAPEAVRAELDRRETAGVATPLDDDPDRARPGRHAVSSARWSASRRSWRCGCGASVIGWVRACPACGAPQPPKE